MVNGNEDSLIKGCTELGLLNPMSTEHFHKVVGGGVVLDGLVEVLEQRRGWGITVHFNLEDLGSGLV
jgi:hypothetical protein